MSHSPARSAASDSGGSPSLNVTEMSGKRSLTRASARGTRDAEDDGKAISRTRPARRPGDRGDLLLGGVERAEDPDRVTGQHLPGLGQPDVASDALDEHRPGALLEAAHHLGDGGLRVPQGHGGAGEAALLGDGLHDPEAGGVDHDLSV